MIEALQLEFMQNALIAGLLASIICGVLGTLVVVNRIVFLSGGIAHAAYGGIGLAFFLGWPIHSVFLSCLGLHQAMRNPMQRVSQNLGKMLFCMKSVYAQAETDFIMTG